MRDKCIPLYLPQNTYERLVALAWAEERDPSQQARWLLRRALEEGTPDLGTPQRWLVSAGE